MRRVCCRFWGVEHDLNVIRSEMWLVGLILDDGITPALWI